MGLIRRSILNNDKISDEEFKDCPYNSLLQVSQNGEVKNKVTNEIMPKEIRNGCFIVKDPRGMTQYDNGSRDYEWVHRLVALTWLTDSPAYMIGAVHHKDGNGLNNNVNNLEWLNNNDHKIKHGLN
jgi:hypothetical protein